MMLRFGSARRGAMAAAVGLATLAGTALLPHSAHAWWVRGGWGWGGGGVVIGVPPIVVRPPVVVAPPVAYAQAGPHWMPGHYNWRGYWVPGHWV
jgi:hypothetical protein